VEWSVVLINIWAFSCLYMGHFVPALNGPCLCPPMGRDLGPNPARYNGPCRPGTKLFRAVPCLGRAFFRASGRPIWPGPNLHLYLQHGGKSKDGNNYAFKCKYLKLSFLMCLVKKKALQMFLNYVTIPWRHSSHMVDCIFIISIPWQSTCFKLL
jgi:hypothetical protein